jgi:hypothetical protein
MKKISNNGLLTIFVLTVMISSVYIVNNIDVSQIRKNTASVSDPLNNGLVAYWKFDGEDGVNVKDSSNAGNNFKFTQATFVAGKVGQAVDLNKSFGNIPHSESLSIDRELTISFWLYPRSFPVRNTTLFAKAKGNLEAVNYSVYFWGEPEVALNRGIDLWAGVSDSHWGSVSPKTPVRMNEWQHLAFTYTSDNGG